jgi:enamine deaminase RidA (YjgF/YER057c/UK114 family)
MKEPFELVLKNQYRLSCRPEPTPDGKFLARAIVSWIDKGGEALSHRLRPEMPPFATAADAAIAARDAATAWLDARDAEGAGAAAAPPRIADAATSPPRPALPTTHVIHDMGVAGQIGSYSDAIEAGPNLRWLVTSGTPGLSAAGELPRDIVGQSDIAWQHLAGALDKAGMTVADIVKVTQYLTRAEDIAAYAKVRSRYLGEARPASMLLVVSQLVWPGFLVEVEIIAAKAAAPA